MTLSPCKRVTMTTTTGDRAPHWQIRFVRGSSILEFRLIIISDYERRNTTHFQYTQELGPCSNHWLERRCRVGE